jgi:hypothetical protein
MKMKKIITIACAPLIVAALVSCEQPAGNSGGGPSFTASGQWGTKETHTYTIQAAQGEKLYLMKINQGHDTVPGEYTGSARSVAGFSRAVDAPRENNLSHFSGGVPRVTHHQKAMEFNALPPLPAVPDTARSASRSLAPSFSLSTNWGSTHDFWVDDEQVSGGWKEIPATLRAEGTYCKIWVADENYDNGSVANNDLKITDARIGELQAKFHAIYPLVTGFFGHEYGGAGPNGGKGGDPSGTNGIDGDEKIHILVYDIGFNGAQDSGTAGFFWGKDEWTQAQLGSANLKSNEAEIFYIDAHFTDKAPDLIYSTLIHEFQHMIHFNQKTLRLGRESQTWYNEMLSLLAEDLFCKDIGIQTTDNAHPIKARIPFFKTFYWARGVTEGDWLSDRYAIISYANTYAFGAYLVRNYGGAALLRAMATNNSVDITSVDSALKQLSGNRVSFSGALEQFPLVLLNDTAAPGNYTSNGVLQNDKFPTFNNSVSGNSAGLPDRDFTAFNITTIGQYNANDQFFDGLSQGAMPANGINFQFLMEAASTTPQVSVTRYSNSPVRLIVVGKKTNGAIEIKKTL